MFINTRSLCLHRYVGVKQLTDFLRTVTAASDLVDCTLVNCETVDVKYLKILKT